MKIIVTAIYNFNGLNKHPLLKIFEKQLGNLFMKYRNEIADEFNKHLNVSLEEAENLHKNIQATLSTNE